MQYINRICKQDGTAYHDPGGDVNDPKRYCPNCGSRAWYAPDTTEGSEDEHPVGAVEIAELLGVKPQTVHMWHYRRLLPRPRWQVSGHPAWLQREVLEWADGTGRKPYVREPEAATAVWVLTRATPYEGETLMGAYSSPELAESAGELPSRYEGDTPYVYSVPLDADPRSHYGGERHG